MDAPQVDKGELTGGQLVDVCDNEQEAFIWDLNGKLKEF